jgi:hypothetical protein
MPSASAGCQMAPEQSVQIAPVSVQEIHRLYLDLGDAVNTLRTNEDSRVHARSREHSRWAFRTLTLSR